jgi:hypothetical protein
MLASIVALVEAAISEAPEIIDAIEAVIAAFRGSPQGQTYTAKVKAMQAQLELIK